MTNHAIARAFTRLADLLEIQGENPFKIRAYRKAAETIERLTENLESIAARAQLESIPSIGKGIAGKIQELCEAGEMREYEGARQVTPEGLLELLALPGFGPRKIQTVYESLGVTSLDALEQAARQGRMASAPGFGAASAERLLEAIAAYRRRSSRWPIPRALPYAQALARSLRATGTCSRVEVAGSVRRLRDTVEDINLVADAPAALAAFTALPEIGETLDQDGGFVRARSMGGLPVTLAVTDQAGFPHLLREATGSAGHNEAMAARAKARGFAIAEDGVLREAGGSAVDAVEEADLFTRLGLPWIPPEIREGRGEVEAAAEGRLPEMITEAALRGILHCHSTWSDGRATVAEMAAAARAQGHAFIGMTDHSRSLGVARGLDEERLRAQMAEIDSLNAASPDQFRILRGLECDILADGTLDLPVAILNELDIVIGSIHSHFRQDQATMTARIIAAIHSGCVDVIAHPTGRILGGRDPYAVDINAVIEAAARTGTALEINADPSRLDLNDEHAWMARQAGVRISLNTDAHHPDALGLLFYGVATARRAWLTPEDVINTWPLDRLMEWLRQRS